MVDIALLHETSELISKNFSANEIDALGRIIFKSYNNHKLAGVSSHITLSSKKCAAILVDYCNENKKTFELIKLLVELDESTLNGRSLSIEGLEEYLNKLTRAGIYYDFRKRKVLHSEKELSELVNWGSLKEGKEYPIVIMSLDIVNNSKLVKKYGTKKMEKVYFRLRNFLQEKLRIYNGRLWSFAGDGGLAAFTFKNDTTRGVLCALDIQFSMSIFNIDPEVKIEDPVQLRIGIDTGKIKFLLDTGNIVSDVINFAAHMEKYGTKPGQISISHSVIKQLDTKISRIFKFKTEFEGKSIFSTELSTI